MPFRCAALPCNINKILVKDFMKRLSKEEYLTRLKEIQPELQIVGEYKGANIKIRVKDRLGINYLCKPYNLLAGKVPNLSSAVNKTLAYNTRLNQVFSNLVVDNYEDGNIFEIDDN